jgi:tripartite-type tricarboxylate transporter receptor subunit TctC
MKLPRRRFLHLAAGAAALPAVSPSAWAQAYPTRPVRLILGYAAGGAPDIVARLIGQWLSERLGQQFIIDNRPGAGSNIGTEAAVRAPPDGYTILYVTTANAISASVFQKLSFNFIRDIAPVAGIIRIPNLVSVNPSLPIKTIPQLIADAKANPGKLNFGAPTATTPQLSGELFNMMTGVSIVHVPYRNQTQAVTDQIAGQIQIGFDAMPTTIEHAKAGKLRALAVTTERARRRCRTSRLSAISCQATRRVHGTASACPRTRLPKSPISSTGRLMRPSPIPRCRRNWPNSAARCFRARLRISESSLLMKRGNGVRSPSSPASSRSETDPPDVP